MFDGHTILHRSEKIHTRRVDEDTVAFHPDRGEYFAMGAVGSRVWDLLAEPTTFEDLCDRLVEEFGVDRSTCARDVTVFLTELRAAQMLREPAP